MAKSKFSIEEISNASMRKPQRDNVETENVSRDHVVTDQISRDKAMEAKTIPSADASKPIPSYDHVKTDNVPRGNVMPDQIPVAVPRGYRVRTRIEKPHVSIYADPKVLDTVRDLARSQGRKAHDIYIDGLRLVLRQHGFDFDELNRGE